MQLPAFTLHPGDCLESLRAMPDNSVDSIVTDPPYGLSFMGKRWDYDVPSVEIWAECLRVLKPGGHLLAFAGTRTQHRMAVRIEDAGFEIRDMIAWTYGSGFPKSLDVSKAIDKAAGAERQVVGERKKLQSYGADVNDVYGGGPDNVGIQLITAPATEAARQWSGWGTALKPALEPITVARKPLSEKTVAANVLQHGTGALNIDRCRVEPTGESRERIGEASQDRRYTENGGTNFAATPSIRGGDPAGRWPANLIHDGSYEVLTGFPDSASPWIGNPNKGAKGGAMFGGSAQNTSDKPEYRDAGSAARFFYCAKASKRDRDEGLEGFEAKTHKGYAGATISGRTMVDGEWVNTENERQPRANIHPTVKPTDLMAYLVRLVTPLGGRVLDPFMGSGSTGKAAMREGFNFIGCELSPEYLAIAEARIQHELAKRQRPEPPPKPQADLFAA